jgi:Tfp pilus assembly protein PilN
VRPVNLIPPEQRRGDRAPMRTGPLSYVVVGVLAAALVAVTLLVITNNKISDREAERASLSSQVARAEAEAQRLASFAEFASLQEARQQTVSSLARSRFDWERVLRELAIVIPTDVWLTALNATVSPEAAVSGGTSTASAGGTESIAGPSLQIEGCAAGHEAVAKFLAALQDIDGVTRASVLKSDRPELSNGAASGTSDSASSGGCSSRDFISTFQVVAAFDAVQITAEGQEPAPVTPVDETTASTTASADQSQLGDAEQQLAQQKGSAAQQTQKARKANDTFIPGAGTGP